MDAGALNLLFLGLLILIFYFMLIRPQKRRVEQHRRLLESIANGDEVVTIGGIHGRVERINEDDVELEVAPNTVIRVVKSAIARKLTADAREETEAATENSGEETA